MKKIIALSIAVLMVFVVCTSCSETQSTSIFERMGDDTKKWAENYDPSDPPSLTVYAETDDYAADPVDVSSASDINAVFDALSAIQIQDKTDTPENSVRYIVTFNQDGIKYSFVFNDNGTVDINGETFTASGVDELLALIGAGETEEQIADTDQTETDQTETETEQEYAVCSSEAGNFSFLYDSAYTSEVNSNGDAYVYAGELYVAPMLMVCVAEAPDAKTVMEEMAYSYQSGEDETITSPPGDCEELSVGDRTVYGFAYGLNADGTDCEAYLYGMDTANGVALFSLIVPTGTVEQYNTMTTDAIVSFQPDAHYYDDGTDIRPSGSDTAQTTAQLSLVEYQGGDKYTMLLPEGWTVEEIDLEPGYLGVHAYDPDNPDYQIFYYNNYGPLWDSAETQSAYPYEGLLKDAPVLNPATVENALTTFPSMQQYISSYYSTDHNFPLIENINVLSSDSSDNPMTELYGSAAVDAKSLCAAHTAYSGATCRGIFSGAVADYGTASMGLPSYSVYSLAGISMPEEDFGNVSSSLLQCLASFRFTEKYVSDALEYMDSALVSAQEYMAANEAMMDIINAQFSAYILS